MMQRIKTNIKFYKGLNNVQDRLYGFVTKINGRWRGCRDTEVKKKIVFVDPEIAENIIPNVLYSCSLVPMSNDKGFIVKSASVIKFPGVILTVKCKNNLLVNVKFGNKVIIYDPSSNKRWYNDIKTIADGLRKRIDLENAHDVAEDFISSACIIKRLYNQSKENV